MRKSTIIWLSIGGGLIVLGALLFVIVMSANQWNFMKLSAEKYVSNTYEFEDDFQNIHIQSKTAQIEFLKSEDSKTKVVCYEAEKCLHVTEIENNTLSIRMMDTRKWYDYIGIFNFNIAKITVYLPEGVYGDLTVKTSTGNVTLPKEFSFQNISAQLSTGDIVCNASAVNLLQLRTSTGKISISDLSAGRIDLSAISGNISASHVDCGGEVRTEVNTGDVTLTDVTCKNLISDGNTGNLILKNVIAQEKFDIERSTGDIKLEQCDAAELFIETDTGNVKGSLLTEKIFIVETDTGKISVPKSVSGGRCEIETDTGNVKITIQE